MAGFCVGGLSPLSSDAFNQRNLIIGNSGSGKSRLAARMATKTNCAHVTLDDFYWIDQLALKKRGAVAAKQLTVEIASQDRWVIEGVYGWLIDVAAPRATAMLWLDLPWSDCKAGLEARGPCGVSDAEFAGLLDWAERYWSRQTSSSQAAHTRIFAAFPGSKLALTSRAEVAGFEERLAGLG